MSNFWKGLLQYLLSYLWSKSSEKPKPKNAPDAPKNDLDRPDSPTLPPRPDTDDGAS